MYAEFAQNTLIEAPAISSALHRVKDNVLGPIYRGAAKVIGDRDINRNMRNMGKQYGHYSAFNVGGGLLQAGIDKLRRGSGLNRAARRRMAFNR
jgi:hypothetical protein